MKLNLLQRIRNRRNRRCGALPTRCTRTLGTAAALKTALEKTGAAWKIVDDRLAKNAYLAGKDFTIGDIPLGVWVYRWFNLAIEWPKLDNLSRWFSELQKRPAYQKHIMIPMT